MNEIQDEIIKIENKILKNEKDLVNVRDQIDEINRKYIIEERDSQKIDFNQIIESIASKSIKKMLNNQNY
ncbi:MAG TPA: hypothetical protein VIR55_12415 [Ignavibacteria bacterium]